MTLLQLFSNVIDRRAQHGSGHAARILEPDAAMAEGSRIAIKQRLLRRIVHVDGMFIGEQYLEFTQRIRLAGRLAHIVGNLRSILAPIDRR